MLPEFLEEREKKVLEVDARKNIYAVVKVSAGSHFREIERKSGLSTGSVKHHLDYLEKNGLVAHEKEGNTLRYFPREFHLENKKMMGLLRQESMRKILLFLLTHNNPNHEQFVAYVELSPSTVSWHLKKLEEEQIIKTSRKGRKTFYALLFNKSSIMNLLITYQESFFDTLVDNVIKTWEMN